MTADDVAALNRAMVERGAAFARIAGTVLIVVGAVGLIAALWVIGREQQHLDSGMFSFGDEGEGGASLLDRIDLISTRFGLVELPVLIGGIGLGLRLVADYVVSRTGGTLTGFEVGDEMPDFDDTATDPDSDTGTGTGQAATPGPD